MVTKEEFGALLRRLRLDKGMKQTTLADAVKRSNTHISEIEQGNSMPSAELVHLLDEVLESNGQLASALRVLKVPESRHSGGAGVFGRAHLFYPAVVPGVAEWAKAAAQAQEGASPFSFGSRVDDAGVRSALHVFPSDVVVVHEEHPLVGMTLRDVARWRRQSVERHVDKVREELARLGAELDVSGETYCLASFVVESLPHGERRRDRVLQLLACSSALLVDADSMEAVDEEEEAKLVTSREKLSDFHGFADPGRHVGWAAWSGVAIKSSSSSAAHIDDFVKMEIELQAMWCLARHAVVTGRSTAEEYGARYFEGARLQLASPAATEHTSIVSMREALVRSSGIRRVLRTAAGALK